MALNSFRAVAEFAPADHWTIEEQKSLCTLFDSAQLETDPNASDRWLHLASLWSPSGPIEADLFPPPLYQKFCPPEKELPTDVDLDRLRSNFRFVLAGNQRIDLKEETDVHLPAALMRITFLSDLFQPSTVQMNSDRLVDYDPPQSPWVSGSCFKPEVHSS